MCFLQIYIRIHGVLILFGENGIKIVLFSFKIDFLFLSNLDYLKKCKFK